MKFQLFLLLLLSSQLIAQQELPVNVTVTGDGPPAILIPGLACDGAVWDETVTAISKDFTCHVLTLPGFAGQDTIDLAGGFLPQLEAWIVAYSQQLPDHPVLIGHSLGGLLSLSIAAHHPDLPAKVIIVDSYPFYTAAMVPDATAESAAYQASMMKNMLLSMPQETYEQGQFQQMRTMVQDSTHAAMIAEWAIRSHRPTVAQAMYEVMTTDLREEVKQTNCPILVLGAWYAAKDYGFTSESVAANFQAQFAGATDRLTLLMAPKAYHFIMLDEPAWYQQQLLAFLQQ